MTNYWLAPFVVALRMPALAREAQAFSLGKGGRRRRESERMVTEKIAAANEGAMLAGLEAMRINTEIGLMAMRGEFDGIGRVLRGSPARIADAAGQPAERRMRSNLRRLTPR